MENCQYRLYCMIVQSSNLIDESEPDSYDVGKLILISNGISSLNALMVMLRLQLDRRDMVLNSD